VPASQTLLFLDPRPLVERLGEEFFRQLPARPGVYLMQDAARQTWLYSNKQEVLTKDRLAPRPHATERHTAALRPVCRSTTAAKFRQSAELNGATKAPLNSPFLDNVPGS